MPKGLLSSNSKRVQLWCQYGVRAEKPYIWYGVGHLISERHSIWTLLALGIGKQSSLGLPRMKGPSHRPRRREGFQQTKCTGAFPRGSKYPNDHQSTLNDEALSKMKGIQAIILGALGFPEGPAFIGMVFATYIIPPYLSTWTLWVFMKIPRKACSVSCNERPHVLVPSWKGAGMLSEVHGTAKAFVFLLPVPVGLRVSCTESARMNVRVFVQHVTGTHAFAGPKPLNEP